MKHRLPHTLEAGRIRRGPLGSESSSGHFGAFLIDGPCHMPMKIISSGAFDEFDWEHVSVSLKNRCPNWQEMCFVKDLFWDEDEVVMQLHPAKKDYINHHPYCLHLWKPTKIEIPLPQSILVGPRDGNS